MIQYVRYEHHGVMVWVAEELIGKHREHCLCYSCAKFNPEWRDENCPIANALYALNVLASITTPVFECPAFKEGKEWIGKEERL